MDDLQGYTIPELVALEKSVRAELGKRKAELNRGFSVGDEVRHKQHGWRGRLVEFSKSGKRGYIRWHEAGHWPSYIQLQMLENVAPNTQSEMEV